ncbi:MAG: hypothetical protein IJ461_01470 [Clostridia bacterium]|nr:hypothetical protein [Clostridia bacterium]
MKKILAVLLALMLFATAKGEALPVYEAVPRDFTQNMQPQWFNDSGVAGKDGRDWLFNDGARLHCAPEAVCYEGPEASIQGILLLASWYGEACPLERKVLACISLSQAQERVEELLEQMGVRGYVCERALDMPLERIRTLTARLKADLTSGRFSSNQPPLEVDRLSVQQEGYYLCYRLPGANSPEDFFSAYAYVTVEGVRWLMLRENYCRGEAIGFMEPVSQEVALANLEKAAAPEKVLSLTLTYGLTEIDEKAVFAPVWLALYKDEKALSQGYDCWAIFSGKDGRLLDAIFAGVE